MTTPTTTPQDAQTFDRLEAVEWGEQHFGSRLTDREFPRRSMLRLVDRGLVASAGFVYVCDDDGCLRQPERIREGFKLTDLGRSWLAQWRASHCIACVWNEPVAGLTTCATCSYDNGRDET
jgi:hypothetical protein